MSGIFKKDDIEAGYLLRVKNVESGELFNMTVVPVSAWEPAFLLRIMGIAQNLHPEGCLACCDPGQHWWPLSSFDDQLVAAGDELFEVVEVYGRTDPKFLLDNSTEERRLLWERAADEDPSVDEPEARKMTRAEIAEALGYPVEIAEG